MAKQSRVVTGRNSKQPQMKDRSTFYTDISYMKPEYKNPAWAAQFLYFAKKNAKLFLDPKRAKKYRDLDNLIMNEAPYRQMFDPITPMGGGGKAAYVSADYKTNPIYIHLKNVVKAELQRTTKQLEVNLTDKYAKTRKMNDNYRIQYANQIRSIINGVNEQLGRQKISDSQDPFKWISNQSIKEGASKDKSPAQPEQGNQQGSDMISGYVDLIRSQIQDSQDLALYNELIYKGDYEIAFEKGIEHYLINQNEWAKKWSDDSIDDIMHFNKAAGEYYTDQITGRPVVEMFRPEELWVSPFRRKDGSDLMYYFIEYYITFGDFVKTMGANLTPEQLKLVFEYNKTQGSNHGFSWIEIDGRPNKTRDDASIRIGKCSVLTQDYDVDMDDIVSSYPNYDSKTMTWLDGKKDTPKMPQSTKHYNVWYTFNYIPPTTNSLSNADYAWQAQFIFDIRKNQDQIRHGEGGRYCKPPLVIYDNSKQASFTDQVEYWMPKINYASMQYQNCLINDIDAIILSDELIGGLVSAVDETNNINVGNTDMPTGSNGRDALLEQWRMIRQRGTGFLKMTDKQGNAVIDPSKLTLIYKNGMLERAEKYLGEIIRMYNMMTMTLAISDAREGMDVKPRTTVAAIEESLKASNNATWYIQKAYEEFLKMYAERMVSYILDIMKEAKEYGYTKRRDEFFEVVGVANGLLIEGMEDIMPENIGLTINYVDNSAKKEFIMQLGLEYVKSQQMDEEFLSLIMGVDNWKYSFVLMRMAIKKRKQEQAHKEELEHMRAMELEGEKRKTIQAQVQEKFKGEIEKIDEKGKVDERLLQIEVQLKTISQSLSKDQIANNRIRQDESNAILGEQERQRQKEEIPILQ